jgi:hypothetical protein
MELPQLRPASNLAYELRFDSLFHEGRALVFPCDEAGRVDLDALSERSRQFYLYARRAVGREYGFPKVLRRNPTS